MYFSKFVNNINYNSIEELYIRLILRVFLHKLMTMAMQVLTLIVMILYYFEKVRFELFFTLIRIKLHLFNVVNQIDKILLQLLASLFLCLVNFLKNI
jgi:hypothetical protein